MARGAQLDGAQFCFGYQDQKNTQGARRLHSLKCLVIGISTLLIWRSGEADYSVHILSKLGVSPHGPIPMEKPIYWNYRKNYICQRKRLQNQHRPTNFGYCHEFGVNLVFASHLNWMQYIHNQLVCCSFETSMSIQYLSLIVSCRNDKETNQVIDQMARPARGYKRRRGTVKTNSHKMWPTSWGVVGIVYVCCWPVLSLQVWGGS
jgi:hypothetical protein